LFFQLPPPHNSTLFPYTTLFRSVLRDFLPDPQPRLTDLTSCEDWLAHAALAGMPHACSALLRLLEEIEAHPPRHSAYLQILERLDRKSTRLNSSHVAISYAVFCL